MFKRIKNKHIILSIYLFILNFNLLFSKIKLHTEHLTHPPPFFTTNSLKIKLLNQNTHIQ